MEENRKLVEDYLDNKGEYFCKIDHSWMVPNGGECFVIQEDQSYSTSYVLFVKDGNIYDQNDEIVFTFKDNTLKEHNMNISYVLNDKLRCGCNSGTADYFYYKLTSQASERIKIMSAIDDFIWSKREEVKKFICFDCKLEDVCELSDVHMMCYSMDKIYKGDCFVAMLDEYGNPSLYSITPREVGLWRKNTNGDEYYISPKTGWVYMYYDLKGRGERKNTDRIAVFNEYSKEKYLLNPEDEPKTFAVPEFVGWCFELDNIHESVEEIIKEHEKDM